MWIYNFDQNKYKNLDMLPILDSVEFSRSTYGAWRTYHSHKEHHLMFCTKGAGLLRIANVEIPLTAGRIALIPAEKIHSLGPQKEGMEFWGISFLPAGENDPLGNLFVNPQHITADFSEHMDYVLGAFHLIYSYGESANIPSFKDSALRSQIYSLLYLGQTCLQKHAIEVTPPSNLPMLNVLNWIIAHYREDITLSVLSKEFSMSSSYLSRSFYSEFHVSPINYLIDYRISIAKEELFKTDKTVREIAESVGYTNTYHFTNLFQKRTGFSPLEMRSHMRNGDTQPVANRQISDPDYEESLTERMARIASEQIGKIPEETIDN